MVIIQLQAEMNADYFFIPFDPFIQEVQRVENGFIQNWCYLQREID